MNPSAGAPASPLETLQPHLTQLFAPVAIRDSHLEHRVEPIKVWPVPRGVVLAQSHAHDLCEKEHVTSVSHILL